MDKQKIHKKYRIAKTLDERNNRSIQLVVCDNHEYILKSVPLTECNRLDNQIRVYKKLNQPQLNGCANLVDSFVENGRKYLVISKFGYNLEQLKNMCGQRFSLKTVLMIGFQMLERIKYVHDNNLLHGDIKPDNFMVGTGKLKHKLYLIDFELAHEFTQNGIHKKHVQQTQIDGTLRFMSLNIHRGAPLSRRDQVESWIYCLLYFMIGDLPWMKLHSASFMEAYEQIKKMKEMKEEELCEGCPTVFVDILKYVRKLKFEDAPDYAMLANKLLALFKKNGYQLDYFFDWEFL